MDAFLPQSPEESRPTSRALSYLILFCILYYPIAGIRYLLSEDLCLGSPADQLRTYSLLSLVIPSAIFIAVRAAIPAESTQMKLVCGIITSLTFVSYGGIVLFGGGVCYNQVAAGGLYSWAIVTWTLTFLMFVGMVVQLSKERGEETLGTNILRIVVVVGFVVAALSYLILDRRTCAGTGENMLWTYAILCFIVPPAALGAMSWLRPADSDPVKLIIDGAVIGVFIIYGARVLFVSGGVCPEQMAEGGLYALTRVVFGLLVFMECLIVLLGYRKYVDMHSEDDLFRGGLSSHSHPSAGLSRPSAAGASYGSVSTQPTDETTVQTRSIQLPVLGIAFSAAASGVGNENV
jgi:hypothetical protein